jgi:hypothetical protein
MEAAATGTRWPSGSAKGGKSEVGRDGWLPKD